MSDSTSIRENGVYARRAYDAPLPFSFFEHLVRGTPDKEQDQSGREALGEGRCRVEKQRRDGEHRGAKECEFQERCEPLAEDRLWGLDLYGRSTGEAHRLFLLER